MGWWRCLDAGAGRRTLGPEELAGDVEGFAADDDEFLAFEELLRDGAGQATKEVAFAVNDDLVVC